MSRILVESTTTNALYTMQYLILLPTDKFKQSLPFSVYKHFDYIYFLTHCLPVWFHQYFCSYYKTLFQELHIRASSNFVYCQYCLLCSVSASIVRISQNTSQTINNVYVAIYCTSLSKAGSL